MTEAEIRMAVVDELRAAARVGMWAGALVAAIGLAGMVAMWLLP